MWALVLVLSPVVAQLCGIQADCGSCVRTSGCIWNANACWSSTVNPSCGVDPNCVAVASSCPATLATQVVYPQPVSAATSFATLPPIYASTAVGTTLPATATAVAYPVPYSVPYAVSYPIPTTLNTELPSIYSRPSMVPPVVSTPLYSSPLLPAASASLYGSILPSTSTGVALPLTTSRTTVTTVTSATPVYSSAVQTSATLPNLATPVVPSSSVAYPVYRPYPIFSGRRGPRLSDCERKELRREIRRSVRRNG